MTNLLCAWCLVNLNASATPYIRKAGDRLDPLRAGARAVVDAYRAGDTIITSDGYGVMLVEPVTMLDGTLLCADHFDRAWQERGLRR